MGGVESHMNAHLQLAMHAPQSDDTQLRALVRHQLLSGALGESVEDHAFGGISRGAHCAVCNLAIEAGKSEIQTFGRDGSHRRFHPKCHLLLSCELEDLAQR